MIVEEGLWYVQKGSRVQGPFTAEEVGRFLLLGRVRNTDRVSRDGELWEPVTQVPELIPEALLDLRSDSGWTAYLAARAADDERSPPSAGATSLALPPGGDRRTSYVDALARARSDWRQVTSEGAPTSSGKTDLALPMPPRSTSLLPWMLLGITVAALCVVLWLNATSATIG